MNYFECIPTFCRVIRPVCHRVCDIFGVYFLILLLPIFGELKLYITEVCCSCAAPELGSAGDQSGQSRDLQPSLSRRNYQTPAWQPSQHTQRHFMP